MPTSRNTLPLPYYCFNMGIPALSCWLTPPAFSYNWRLFFAVPTGMQASRWLEPGFGLYFHHLKTIAVWIKHPSADLASRRTLFFCFSFTTSIELSSTDVLLGIDYDILVELVIRELLLKDDYCYIIVAEAVCSTHRNLIGNDQRGAGANIAKISTNNTT